MTILELTLLSIFGYLAVGYVLTSLCVGLVIPKARWPEPDKKPSTNYNDDYFYNQKKAEYEAELKHQDDARFGALLFGFAFWWLLCPIWFCMFFAQRGFHPMQWTGKALMRPSRKITEWSEKKLTHV